MINKRLINMLHKSKKYIVLTVLMNWISLIANVVSIFLIGGLLENVLKHTSTLKDIQSTLIVIIGSIIIRTICNIYSNKTSFLASAEVKKTLRSKIYKKLLTLGVSYNEKISTSEAIQVSVEGIEQLETFFGGYLPQLIYSLLAPLTLFIILSFINLKSALVLLVCVPLIPISIVAVQKFAKKLLNKYWGTYTEMGDSFLENIQGLTTLKIYQKDSKKSDEMDVESEKVRKITMRVLTMQLNSITVMDLVAFGGAAVGTIIALNEFLKGNISFAGAFIIIMLSSEFFIPLRLLGSFFHIAMNGMAASEKIFYILDMENPEMGLQTIESNIRSIEFKNVNFSYEEDRKIIKNNSFKILKGEMVSFVGESGSGKSTIAGLIMGRNKGYDGNIIIGEKELSNITEKSIMENITLVDSNSYLFKGTVRENLAMGKSDITEEEMNKMLKKVNLFNFLKSENGLDTILLEKGSNFSGGQHQRLVLARAILRNTDVYIFDEVTSNIDMESEEQIMNVIYNLSKEKTIILISHRLANVVNSDKTYVLKKGEIVEEGTHKKLISKNSTYKDLYIRQYELEKYGREREVSHA